MAKSSVTHVKKRFFAYKKKSEAGYVCKSSYLWPSNSVVVYFEYQQEHSRMKSASFRQYLKERFFIENFIFYRYPADSVSIYPFTTSLNLNLKLTIRNSNLIAFLSSLSRSSCRRHFFFINWMNFKEKKWSDWIHVIDDDSLA